MKIIIVCLMLMFTCSCRQVIDDFHSMKRRGEISEIMKERWRTGNDYFDRRNFEIRGPLTVTQFEKELIVLYEESAKIRKRVYGISERFEDSETGKECSRLKGKYKEADELYFYRSDSRSWTDLMGVNGYVIIRKDEIVDMIVTGIN